MWLRAGVTCISQCRGREGGPHSCSKEHCLHDRPAGKLLTASEQTLGVSSCACTCWLDQSPWEVSLFARGSASDKEVRVGGGRETVGVPSAQPSDVGEAGGWISAVTTSLSTVVGGEQSSMVA